MLAICTPIHRQVEPDFFASLQATLRTGGGAAIWLHTIGHANLPRARNYLVQEARDRGAGAIVFIDADIGWDADAFGALFDCPDDVRVLAGAPRRREEKMAFCGSIDRHGLKQNGRLMTGTAATAFLRVDASVFDDLDGKVESYGYQGRQYPGFFQTPIIDGDLKDEDVFFSHLCKANGIDVWIDPHIRLRHWANMPMTGCIADHLPRHELKEAV